MESHTITNRTEKPNSYEFGKAGNRFKLYFDTASDLSVKINQLKSAGILEDEEVPEETEV